MYVFCFFFGGEGGVKLLVCVFAFWGRGSKSGPQIGDVVSFVFLETHI